ncbi:thermonuclease family protein [Methylolobus aquaticus]
MGIRSVRVRWTGAALLSGLLWAQTGVATDWIEGKVVGVADGDTLTVLDAGKRQHKIRLHQIDAPEKKQDYGMRSKQSLSDLAFGKTVRVEVVDIDRYRREVGKIWVGPLDANLEQVKRGMAWVYRKYAREQSYYAAEEAARKARIGLWAQPNPIPPWEFRHRPAIHP